MANFCQNCGIKVNTNWRACPDCGYNLTGVNTIPQQPTQQYNQSTPQYTPSITPKDYPSDSPQQYPQKSTSESGEKYGNLSILFGIIGSLMPLPFLVASIILGSLGLNKDDDPTLSKIGLASGVVVAIMWGFIFALIFAILL